MQSPEAHLKHAEISHGEPVGRACGAGEGPRTPDCGGRRQQIPHDRCRHARARVPTRHPAQPRDHDRPGDAGPGADQVTSGWIGRNRCRALAAGKEQRQPHGHHRDDRQIHASNAFVQEQRSGQHQIQRRGVFEEDRVGRGCELARRHESHQRGRVGHRYARHAPIPSSTRGGNQQQ